MLWSEWFKAIVRQFGKFTRALDEKIDDTYTFMATQQRGEQGITSSLSSLFESEQMWLSRNEKSGFIYGWLWGRRPRAAPEPLFFCSWDTTCSSETIQELGGHFFMLR